MPVASVHLAVCYTATLSEVFPGLAVRHEERPDTSSRRDCMCVPTACYREAILHTRLPAASDSAMLFPGFPRPFTFI